MLILLAIACAGRPDAPPGIDEFCDTDAPGDCPSGLDCVVRADDTGHAECSLPCEDDRDCPDGSCHTPFLGSFPTWWCAEDGYCEHIDGGCR